MTVLALLTTGGGGVSGLVTVLGLGFGLGFGLDLDPLVFEPISSPSNALSLRELTVRGINSLVGDPSIRVSSRLFLGFGLDAGCDPETRLSREGDLGFGFVLTRRLGLPLTLLASPSEFSLFSNNEINDVAGASEVVSVRSSVPTDDAADPLRRRSTGSRNSCDLLIAKPAAPALLPLLFSAPA